ncbi:MAG: hypothetical protein KIT22_03190 [Verrucomicrobiae bacterium]|nr:hypothetical protein [Verrucomicrobiae bacterium]
MGIQRPERIAAHAAVVLENQAQFRLKGEVGSDEDASESVRILPIKRLAVRAVVAGLEADVIGAGFIARTRVPDAKIVHPKNVGWDRGFRGSRGWESEGY